MGTVCSIYLQGCMRACVCVCMWVCMYMCFVCGWMDMFRYVLCYVCAHEYMLGMCVHRVCLCAFVYVYMSVCRYMYVCIPMYMLCLCEVYMCIGI